MIIKNSIITDIRIDSVDDLYKLKPFMDDSTLKINKSQIARDLGVDRRTVGKYIDGYEKPKTRKCKNCITDYYSIIEDLLSDNNQQVFYYRSVLWRYLVDNHSFEGSYANFCHGLKKYPELDGYFKSSRPSNMGGVSLRYETGMGEQAQLDWKESMKFVLSDGREIEINIFVLILSYSRFRVYRLSLSKTQDVLLSFMDDAFETFGGVPGAIVTDNMKTVMDEARTQGSDGKVNARFQQFADDYGFKVQPCIAGKPQTKGKVESPMRILDEIRAYSGKLGYAGLNELLARINDRENNKVNGGSGLIPTMCLDREKASLKSLPPEAIRKPYRIPENRTRANSSSMVSYRGCQYSVPPKYSGRNLVIQAYDNYLHVYYNTELVAIHEVSDKKLNYTEEHYIEIARKSHAFREEDIAQRARENLKAIGELYGYSEQCALTAQSQP